MRRALAAALLGLAVAGGPARSESGATAAGAEATLDAFHAALASGDREGALARLAPEAVIFESGGAELSRGEYAEHHLAEDLEFLAATRAERLDRRVEERGEAAWILTRTRTSGTFRDRPVESSGTETAILLRADGGWRIVHLHWSSRAAR